MRENKVGNHKSIKSRDRKNKSMNSKCIGQCIHERLVRMFV